MTLAHSNKAQKTLHDLASQVYILAIGLQNAAPPGAVGKSIQYLLDTSAQLDEISQAMQSVLTSKSSDSKS